MTGSRLQCALLTLADFGELHTLKTQESEGILDALQRLDPDALLICRDYRNYSHKRIVRAIPFGRTVPRLLSLIRRIRSLPSRRYTMQMMDSFTSRKIDRPMLLVTVPRNGYRRTLEKNRLLGGINIAYEDFAYPGYSRRNYHKAFRRKRTEEIPLLDHVLVLSELSARTYLNEGFDNDRVHCVGMGADLDAVSPAHDAGRDSRKLRVLCLGGDNNGRKGFRNAARAWMSLDPENAELHIVGIQPGDIERELRGPGVSNIFFKPFTSKPSEEIANADILLHPALFEPFGRVVTEAMAAGRPVIVSDMTGAQSGGFKSVI